MRANQLEGVGVPWLISTADGPRAHHRNQVKSMLADLWTVSSSWIRSGLDLFLAPRCFAISSVMVNRVHFAAG